MKKKKKRKKMAFCFSSNGQGKKNWLSIFETHTGWWPIWKFPVNVICSGGATFRLGYARSYPQIIFS